MPFSFFKRTMMFRISVKLNRGRPRGDFIHLHSNKCTGLTTTKLYISTSSYIKKQSNIPIDGVWDTVWTILYYYFIYKNYKKLNGRNALYRHQWTIYKNKNIIKKEGKKIILKLTNQ